MAWWQVACGAGGRNYAQLFVEHDLMLLGPGDPGPYDQESYCREVESGRLSRAKQGAIQRFCKSVQPGDIVLLRKGRRVIEVGVVPEEGYRWNEAFDDVRGWDLQHTRRVVWQDHLRRNLHTIQDERDLFASRKQIPMFTAVRDESILGPLTSLVKRFRERTLRGYPPRPSEVLSDDALGEELFSRGLSNKATEDVVAALTRQRRLLQWYADHGRQSGRPTETEVVAHMVLPLLLALGWSEQLLAVEWNKVDLAGFRRAPTTPESCSLVCEAKGLGHGLGDVLEQATAYIESLGLRNCRRVLLTEGGRYYLYSGSAERQWSDEPTGYFNVEKMRLVNAGGTNAVETLLEVGRAT